VLSQGFGDYFMKKTQMALAAVALVASSAAFAEVTLYGTLDTSVAGGGGTSMALDGSGNWAGSIYGIKGSEDLGGGMKAGFELQAGINAGTGGVANGGGDGIQRTFNRQSNVSLGGDFGTVKLGMQLSPFIAGSLGGYVNNNGSFYVRSLAMTSTSAGGNSTATGFGGDAASGLLGGFFIPNAISYSVSAGGISASVLTQIKGGSTTAYAANEYTAATVGTSLGGVTVNGSYENRGGTNSSTNNAGTGYNLNASTNVAGIKVAGGYTNFDPAGTTAAINGYNVGFAYPVSDALEASLQYASATGGKSLANIGLQYNLSKSTFAYVTVAQGAKTAVLYAGGPGSATSASTTGYAVGIAHSF
jgi:predicted porin